MQMDADVAEDADRRMEVEEVIVGGGEEERDEDEWEVEDEEGGGYMLQFEGGLDPMELLEIDTFGREPYQQFQRLEYEALAEMKRNGLHSYAGKKIHPSNGYKDDDDDDVFGAQFEEVQQSMMSRRTRGRSGQPKRRGRRKGSKKNLNPEVTKKLGDATLCYASGCHDEAIRLLEDVVRIAPNLPDAYHTLALVYNDLGNQEKSMGFCMIAALLSPKDPSMWNQLVAWSVKKGNTGLLKYCLSKAIIADPKDLNLRLTWASLYVGLGDYRKAADVYEQILLLYPANIDVRKMAANMHKRCGQIEKAVFVLESHLYDRSFKVDFGIVGLLMCLHMESGSHAKALKAIEHARSYGGFEKGLPCKLLVKEAICHAFLGEMHKSKDLLVCLNMESAEDVGDLILEVADSFCVLGCYDSALKYYFMMEGMSHENSSLYYKISRCYLAVKDRMKALPFLYKVLSLKEDHIDARITLCEVLGEEGRIEEAISLLSPPDNSELNSDQLHSMETKPWWLDGKVRMLLAKNYQRRGMLKEFVDALLPSIRESLFIESLREEIPIKKKLNMRELHERAKLLDDHDNDVFRGFKPIATASEMVKAVRAKKLLKKRTTEKEERKARALALGIDWLSDDSDEEAASRPNKLCEPPIPNLLKDSECFQLIIDLCKAMVSLQQYWDALEIMNHALKFTYKTVPPDKKEELRLIGAQIASYAIDPAHGYDFVRSIVLKYPKSCAAWNFYYKVITRCNDLYRKHIKFLHNMLAMERPVFPMIIHGHQFTANSQHQDAARAYLNAQKLQPDNPLINLCVGTALVNLALGFRLKNKHLTVVQGLAFLYEYLHLCNSSQEALYNVARALHHVGLVTLAASYYEKVLAMEEKDCPIPKLSYDMSPPEEIKTGGYCNLRREAAYNLHLIYRKSGALDLARQVLRTYCCT